MQIPGLYERVHHAGLNRLSRARLALAPSALQRLALSIETSVAGSTPAFLDAADQAREKFLREAAADTGLALQGVKIINLLVTKHEYLHGYVAKAARPIGFLVDPANQCHLGCPSCTNTFNRGYAEATFDLWPPGLMKPETFDDLIDYAGPYAYSAMFYNKHEPLLNKRTPEFVRKASDLGEFTSISSNLSFSKLDAEAIVRSGLNELMVAIDGATQPVYERYRKGGRIDWVYANVRAIADARTRLGMTTPHLRWQYLTFRHNLEEIPAAVRKAQELGFDEFNLATPFTVADDDPTVEACEPESLLRSVRFAVRPRSQVGDPSAHRTRILRALEEPVRDRWQMTVGAEAPKPGRDRCDWLHTTITVDALGAVRPCCIGDYKGQGQFVFGSVAQADVANAPAYREARRALIEPRSETVRTRCVTCPSRPPAEAGLNGARRLLGVHPELRHLGFLHDWSSHAEAAPV